MLPTGSVSLGSMDQTPEDWVVDCMVTLLMVRTVSPACPREVFIKGTGWEFPVYLICSLDRVEEVREHTLKVFSLLFPPSSRWKRNECRRRC